MVHGTYSHTFLVGPTQLSPTLHTFRVPTLRHLCLSRGWRRRHFEALPVPTTAGGGYPKQTEPNHACGGTKAWWRRIQVLLATEPNLARNGTKSCSERNQILLAKEPNIARDGTNSCLRRNQILLATVPNLACDGTKSCL